MEAGATSGDVKYDATLTVVVLCLINDVPNDQIAERLSIEYAQRVIDCLHEWLLALNEPSGLREAPPSTVSPTHRRKARRLLVSLCERLNILPARRFLPPITLGDFVASGGFSDVYRAQSLGKFMAAKVVRVKEYGKRFCREVMTGTHLHHAFVLPILGVAPVASSHHLAILMPYCAKGNIVDWIIDEARFHERGRLVGEIVNGLTYLHSENVVHGDLRGRNILVSDQGHVQLADYGLAGFSDASIPNSSLGGCMEWMAPELLHPSKYDLPNPYPKRPSSDVYSFASVCVEIFTGKSPFRRDRSDYYPLLLQIVNGVRPARPSANECGGRYCLPDALWALMQQCWADDPSERPTAHLLLAKVRQVQWSEPEQALEASILRPRALRPKLTPLQVPSSSVPETVNLRVKASLRPRSPSLAHPLARPSSPWSRPSSPLVGTSRPCSPSVCRTRPSSPSPISTHRPISPTMRRGEPRARCSSQNVDPRPFLPMHGPADPIFRPWTTPRDFRFPVTED